jgi:membrane-associated phospholipid phosphatase
MSHMIDGRTTSENESPANIVPRLGVCLVSVGIFLVTIWSIQGHGGFSDVDAPLLSSLHDCALTAPLAVDACKFMTQFGSMWAIAGVAVLLLVMLVYQRKSGLLCWWLVILVGGGLLDQGLKEVFQRERPHITDPVALEQSYSFPSGHALGSAVSYGFIMYLLVARRPPTRSRLAMVGVLVVWVLVIGFTRLFLGLHHFTDVIGGFAAGTAWLAACLSGMAMFRRGQCRRSVKTADSTGPLLVVLNEEIP